MRKIVLFCLCIWAIGCAPEESNGPVDPPPPLNEVLVLGAIHHGHLTSEFYGTDKLRRIIRNIDPDYVLTEIPPDRFPAALQQFQTEDTITEPRVKLFPEYVDVLFPLTKEMDFEIIPTAGWTKEMADNRREKLKTISQDTARKAEWRRYLAGEAAADSAIAALGGADKPEVIHTDAYDAAVELWAGPYNEMFNDELGAGGWDHVNEAHFANIEKALNAHTGEGKRFLIIYGSYHKGWMKRALRKRSDVKLLSVKDFLSS